MRSLFLPVLLGCALAGGCSKQSRTTAPPPAAAPAPTAPGNDAAPPPQGIAVGEPHPGAPGARPAAITDADIVLAERLLVALVKIADGVTRAGSDCATAATAIRAVGPELEAIASEAKKMQERLKSDSAAEDWFDKTYGPKAMASMGPLMNSPCMNDPAVSQAMQSLNF